ncbi:MAG: hypothetical protein WBK77_01445 [Alphaproteobacteria bacterium]
MSAIISKVTNITKDFGSTDIFEGGVDEVSRRALKRLDGLISGVTKNDYPLSLDRAKKIRDVALEEMSSLAACHTSGVDRSLFLMHLLKANAVEMLQRYFVYYGAGENESAIYSYKGELETMGQKLQEKYDPFGNLYTHHYIDIA